MTARKPIVIDPADSSQCAELPAGDWVDQLPIFRASGLLAGARIFVDSFTIDPPAKITVDYSAANFSAVPFAFFCQVNGGGLSVTERAIPHVLTGGASSTEIEVSFVTGRNLGSFGGNTLIDSAVDSATLFFMAIGV